MNIFLSYIIPRDPWLSLSPPPISLCLLTQIGAAELIKGAEGWVGRMDVAHWPSYQGGYLSGNVSVVDAAGG